MADSNQQTDPGILVRSHLMWLRGFMESVAPDAVPKVDMALGRLDELVEQFDAAMDCMSYAWTIICNVNEGDWAMQPPKWQEAAAKCRDQYHALLASNPASRPS